MNIELEARNIIYKHTADVMAYTYHESKNNQELWEFMIEECGFIIAENFLDGEYTPMEYNAIRNEVAKILNGIFEPICEKEMMHELKQFVYEITK